ncbi:sporulation-induced protein [Sporothrix curviconia]|uniref:Sporulation-induced protein n=1 Tax=Sporothrix curviconia TaxID=1260050 RepID=A0ABP0CXU9_9PEZI
MFWKFGGYANISPIDAILDRPDFTLEELLDESDLLGDVKAHNNKLLEYLRQRDIVLRLLEYVVAPKAEPVPTPEVAVKTEDDQLQAAQQAEQQTEQKAEQQAADASALSSDEPADRGRLRVFGRSRASSSATDTAVDEEDEAEKKRTRYAFVSCEILASDNWSICDTILDPANRVELDAFWQFLKRPAPLDPLQASYFTKVNESLFDKKLEEMVAFLKTADNAIQDMLRHVDCPMVMDLLLKIITLDRPDAYQGIVEWLYTQDIMPTLLSFLSPENSWATQTSAGDFIKAIITVSANATQHEQTCIGPNELTRQLVSHPCIDELIGYMLKGGNALTVGVGIVIEVIRKNNSDYDPDVGTEANSIPSSRDPIYLGTLLRMFAQNVPNFMQLMNNAPAQKSRLNSTFGEKIEPLGFDRFKTCELMAELLHCSNMGLLNEVGSEELIAARDAHRKRLRSEGKLTGTRGEEASPGSADMLTMAMSPADEGRRLEVTNISAADDDGFEEVTHAAGLGEDDAAASSRDVELPIRPAQQSQVQQASTATTPSFLEKDEDDFVEEPLSSPRLVTHDDKVAAVTSSDDHHFDDPELLVAPLSPTKKKSAAVADDDDEGTASKASTASTAPTAPTAPPKDDVEGSDDFVTEATEPALGDEAKRMVPDLEKGDDSDSSIMFTPTISSLSESLDLDLNREPRAPSPTPEATPETTETADQIEKTENEDSDKTETETPSEQNEKTAMADVPANQETVTNGDADTEFGDTSIIVTLQPSEADAEADATPAAPEAPVPDPVVGDFLKMQFVDHRVVPTILSFFFSYPWNNFLHNVVYDVVQQVFNGPLDRGFNPHLAISLFESADITTQIVNGQLVSEQSQAATRMRMGYMGHLTLIAEEVVKFTERHPAELLSETVVSKIMSPDWTNYIDGTLTETRERDNATLGGVRPEVAMGNHAAQAGLAAVGLGSLGLSSGSQQGTSNALAEAGLNGSLDLHSSNLDLQGSNDGHFSISAGISSGFHSSSDEEDDDADDNDEDINNEVSSDCDFPSSISNFPVHDLYRRFGLATGGAGGRGRSSLFASRSMESVTIDELYNRAASNGDYDYYDDYQITMNDVDAKTPVEAVEDHGKDQNEDQDQEKDQEEDSCLPTDPVVPSGAHNDLFAELETMGPIELRALAGFILDSFSDSAGDLAVPEESDNHHGPVNDDEYDRLVDGIAAAAPPTADDFHQRAQNAAELFRAYTDPLNAGNSLLPPAIPPPPPPPPPLNVPPSRARQLLAARLAMNKRNASSSGAPENGGSGDSVDGDNDNDGDISLGVASRSLSSMLNATSGGERLRNPFADDEDDDLDADEDDDDEDDDDDDEDVGLNSGDAGRMGLGWNRGGWWRSMVSRSDKKGAPGAAGGTSSHSGAAFSNEKFGDGRDSSGSSDDGGNSSDDNGGGHTRQDKTAATAVFANDNNSGLDDDDEEFGDFAMPETSSAPAAASSLSSSTTDTKGEADEGIADSNGNGNGTVLFKPLALHPGSQPLSLGGSSSNSTTGGPAGNTAGGSLWRLGLFSGNNDAAPSTTAVNSSSSNSNSNNKTTTPADLEVLDEDGQRVARVTEATHRTSLEDPDEDEVVV